jgi:hypothetical protein
MNFLVIILLIVISAVVITSFLGWLVFNTKVNSLTQEMKHAINDINRIPPFKITLLENQSPKILRKGIFTHCHKELLAANFKSCGFFSTQEVHELTLEAFHHSDGYFAILHEAPEDKTYLEVMALLQEQTLITVTNTAHEGMLTSPQYPKVHLAAPVGIHGIGKKLLRALQNEINGKAIQPWKPEQFQHVFEKSYQNQMLWRLQQGGLSIDEIKANAAIRHQPEPDDEEIQTIKDNWKIAIIGYIEDEIRQNYIKENSIPLEEWELKKDRIFIIHDYSDIDNLACDICSSQFPSNNLNTEDFEEIFESKVEELKEKLTGENFTETFEKINLDFPENKRFEKLFYLDTPYHATLYLGPENI